MDLFSSTKPPDPPLPGRDYLLTLHKYLRTNLPRLAPTAPPPASFLQQSYTLLTLGLDPSSQPLSRSIKIPLTLGLADPTPTKGPVRPLTLRLPPDKLLYLLLRWQALPQNLPHVGRTDVPIAEGVPFVARGAAEREKQGQVDGDVQSVRSWVGSIRSVSLGSMGMGSVTRGWWGKQEPSEDQILLALYSMFNVLPALLIHPPFFSDRPIAELVEAGGYTQLGGVDVRVPLDVLRNLQVLELEGYDPRALLIPLSPNLRSLTVRDVQDGDDWIELLLVLDPPSSSGPTDSSSPQPRFPSLRHLSLPSVSLLSLPSLPLAHLSSLDLSHNLLNAIPSSLSSLCSLRSLNLSYNLITSVRNAPSSLGNISTLNISHNRIDCLVGLDRVLGLERVDVRSNELTEYGEVGRLAVLPNIRAVWTTGNEFNSPTASTGTAGGEGWRVGLGTTFSMEGREVVLDDAPFSWTEKRSIDALLASRGRRRPAHTRTPTQPVSARLPSDSRLNPPANASTSDTLNGAKIDPSTHLSSLALPPRNTEAGPSRSRTGTITSTSSHPQPPASPTPTASTSIAGITKKRRPRRVINLDSTEGEEIKGGSMRLPPKSVLYEEDEGPGRGGDNDGSGTANEGQERGDVAGQEGVVKVKKGRRGRVSASMFEP